MSSDGDAILRNRTYVKKSVNVVELMSKAKFAEKKEKRHSYIVAVAALAVLFVFGYIVAI